MELQVGTVDRVEWKALGQDVVQQAGAVLQIHVGLALTAQHLKLLGKVLQYIYRYDCRSPTHHFVIHDPHHGALFVLLIRADHFLAIGHQTPLLWLQQ